MIRAAFLLLTIKILLHKTTSHVRAFTFFLIKIILPFIFCHPSVFDGMVGAMMVAGETCKAGSVVTPLGTLLII